MIKSLAPLLIISLILSLLANTPVRANALDSAAAPCSIPSDEGFIPTNNPADWSGIIPDKWTYVEGFTDVLYSESKNPGTAWIKTSEWRCGYSYGVRIPKDYIEETKEYPVVVFLHGGLSNKPGGRHWLAQEFYIPEGDPYILVIPAKFEWDWNAKKILDILTDVKRNLRVDADRVYLTGLSMGGRGTFIVAASIPEQFAAIMPLSPHHQPFSYVPLAPKISSLPVWMSHGDVDEVSSYGMAVAMKDALEQAGTKITFHTIVGGRHCCWERIYGNPDVIKWLLDHKRSNDNTAVYQRPWGGIKNDFLRSR
jgi:predicted esterase